MKVRAYAQATHFGPTVLVVFITFVLASTQFSTTDSLKIALAIFAGQCVVGWSNDLIDYPLDLAAARSNKPLVAMKVSPHELGMGIIVALFAAATLSFFGPLGIKGSAIHALGVLSATLYNLKVKRTLLSILPYIFSFGAMPWAIYLAAGKHPSLWLWLGFIIFASAFHFLNALKDLEWDLKQGVKGLPQRLGRNASLSVAAILLTIGTTLVTLKWDQLSR